MIEIKNINKSFGKISIFKDFSYNIEEGKITSIIGQSGCGKSTLVRLISGFEKPDSGQVLYHGFEIKKYFKDVYLMHQKYTNMNWLNCLDNVLLSTKVLRKVKSEDVDRAINMLNKVGLSDSIKKYPYELSGGMQQRLAFARALLEPKKIIIMDEPLSALDIDTRFKMQELLLNLHRDKKNTIIMITHSPEEAEKMSHIILNLNTRKEDLHGN